MSSEPRLDRPARWPLIRALRKALILRGGRPVALGILLWMLTITLLSDPPAALQPLPWPLQFVADAAGDTVSASRRMLMDGYQKALPRQPQSQPVTVVAIDENSLAAFGQWPWPRTRLAALVDAIAANGPVAIGLDIYMPEPDQTSPERVAELLPPQAAELAQALRQLPSHDGRLAQSLAAAPTVLAAAGFDAGFHTTREGMRTFPIVVRGDAAVLPRHVRAWPQVLASLPEFQGAAAGQALVSVDLEMGIVRHVPLVMKIGEQPVPGLALEMLRVATGGAPVELEFSGGEVRSVAVADLRVPTMAGAQVPLHYARLESTAGRYVSAKDVLSGQVPREALAGKLVLVGLTGTGLNDMRTTVLGELVPGIEIQAQVIESLFEGRLLQRPSWLRWAELLTALGLGLFVIWFIPRRDFTAANFLRRLPKVTLLLTLGTNALVIGLGYAAFHFMGILFDAASFSLVITAVVGSVVSTALVEMDNAQRAQERRELEALRSRALHAPGR